MSLICQPDRFIYLPASVALDPFSAANYAITKSGVAALTLAAPGSGDGKGDAVRILITSQTANAHTLTATGLFADGAGHVNLATFAAQIGASIEIISANGKWNVIALSGVTMS